MADMSPNDEKRRNRIDASSLTPQRAGLRFDVVPFVLGYMEQFARADFRIAAMAGTPESFAVSNANLQVLAQSVLASSHIEQEGVYGAEVELVFAAVTQPEDGVPRNGELSERVQAIVDITRAAKWAIESQARFKDWLSFEFVIELHRRMFRATQPQIAGKIKTDEVVISGALYDVSTVPKADAERFLRSLCERLNQRLLRAEAQGTENLILLSAEFVLDFLAIHPFADGNGRTARLLSTYLLDRAGYQFVRFYPLDEVMLETQSDYFEALFLAQRNWYQAQEDITPWINFYVRAIHTQYQRAFAKVLDQQHRNPPL